MVESIFTCLSFISATVYLIFIESFLYTISTISFYENIYIF